MPSGKTRVVVIVLRTKMAALRNAGSMPSDASKSVSDRRALAVACSIVSFCNGSKVDAQSVEVSVFKDFGVILLSNLRNRPVFTSGS